MAFGGQWSRELPIRGVLRFTAAVMADTPRCRGSRRHRRCTRCAISFVGVSNILTWMAAIPPYWKLYRARVEVMVGDPDRDRERLEATSPALHADRIQTPLLIAQGANDPRVKKAESEQMVEALRRRGVAVEYILKEDEGHGFRNEENAIEFYRAAERFLGEHLTDSTVPEMRVGDDALRSGGERMMRTTVAAIFFPILVGPAQVG